MSDKLAALTLIADFMGNDEINATAGFNGNFLFSLFQTILDKIGSNPGGNLGLFTDIINQIMDLKHITAGIDSRNFGPPNLIYKLAS